MGFSKGDGIVPTFKRASSVLIGSGVFKSNILPPTSITESKDITSFSFISSLVGDKLVSQINVKTRIGFPASTRGATLPLGSTQLPTPGVFMASSLWGHCLITS